jgi:hypothetical protein
MQIEMKNNKTLNVSIPVEKAAKMQAYDISYVFDKLIYDQKISEADIPALESEFKKFILLAGQKIYPIAMISPLVDEVWHQFILFTKHYKQFCLETVGFFVGHMPDTPKTPIPEESGENFRQAYRQHFGAIPAIWYKGMDEASLAYYAQPQLIGRPPKLWSGWAGPEN